VPLSRELRQFVEDMGLAYEEDGFPRMAGRVAGWLLVCDPPHQTAAELATALGASGGSISTATRLLIQCGCVERIAIPGQRGAAYRVRAQSSADVLGRALRRARAMRTLLGQGLEILRDASPERRARLHDQYEIHEFIEREIPALLERHGKERP